MPLRIAITIVASLSIVGLIGIALFKRYTKKSGLKIDIVKELKSDICSALEVSDKHPDNKTPLFASKENIEDVADWAEVDVDISKKAPLQRHASVNCVRQNIEVM